MKKVFFESDTIIFPTLLLRKLGCGDVSSPPRLGSHSQRQGKPRDSGAWGLEQGTTLPVFAQPMGPGTPEPELALCGVFTLVPTV